MDFTVETELARFPVLGSDFPEELWFAAEKVASLIEPAFFHNT